MKVTLFTTNTCAVCKTVKRFLDYKKVPYQVVPIDDDPVLRQQIIDEVGYSIVPVTVIEDGEKRSVIAGYNPARLGAALA